MTISSDQAADIARRHGLNLTDAQALSVLADDEPHAEKLAERFAPAPSTDDLADQVQRRIGGR